MIRALQPVYWLLLAIRFTCVLVCVLASVVLFAAYATDKPVTRAIVLPSSEVSFDLHCHCKYGKSQRKALDKFVASIK